MEQGPETVRVSNEFSLEDRTVLLTGAAGHLGRAVALGLADAGAKVHLNGRNREKLAKLRAEIEASGGQADVHPFDVTSEVEIDGYLDLLRQHNEPLHGIVNNAYAHAVDPAKAYSIDAYRESAAVVLGAASYLVEAATDLLEASGGAVVNVASMYGHVSPDPGIYDEAVEVNPPHYGAAKAGLLQLTRHLAVRLAERGIRVNSVSPGPFPSAAVQETNPGFAARLGRKVPMGRIGQPAELVGPIVFLLSDASSYVTGCDLRVDGGWTAW